MSERDAASGGRPEGTVERRTVLGVLASLGVAGCTTAEPSRPPGSTTSATSVDPTPTGTRSPTPSTAEGAGGTATTGASPAPTLPAVRAYRPLPGEVLPECKAAAVATVTQALTWSRGQGAGAAERLGGGQRGRALAAAFAPLLDGAVASAVQPVYPQYGGIGAGRDTASVMFVGRQLLLRPGGTEPVSREFIVDLRLARAGTRWSVRSAALGTPPPPGTVDQHAARLLANRRVILPAPARADLRGGSIFPEVSRLLNGLSGRWRLHVQVLRSGHPVRVFGTDRPSNHTRGRAVDIWAIDDVPLISSSRSLWEPVITQAARLGATEIGAPALPRQRADLPPVFFTNEIHHDHLHLGFEVPAETGTAKQ